MEQQLEHQLSGISRTTSQNANIPRKASDIDLASSDSDVEDGRHLHKKWLESRLNQLPASVIAKNNCFLWAFGDSSKRALSVQQKINQVDIPTVSAIPGNKSMLLGQVMMVASGDEHTACVTDKGRVLVVGSNQHQRLGLANKTILDV